MATSKKTGLRTADLPQVDAVRFADPAQTRAWEQVRLLLNTRLGKGGNEVDKVVTWADLVENGVVAMRGKNGQLIVGKPGGSFEPTNPENNSDAIPPSPTGITVTPGLSMVMIQWNRPTFTYFGYAEVFRSTENNQATAAMIGQTTAWLYSDYTGSSGQTYYYWVRFVSKGGKRGPFNSVDGIDGHVSLDPAYLIDVLSSDNPQALLYEITEETIINGVVVPPGIYIKDLFVANGSISNAKIGNAAIDDAKIHSLSAEKVTFGEMSGDRIAVNSLNADRLTTNTLTAKLASIESAYVGEANIKDASIVTAHIKSLDAEKITSGFISVDRLEPGTIGSAKFTDDLKSDAVGSDGKPLILLNFRTGESYFAGNATFGMGAKFSGELVAATGTFSGTLTANAVNAVQTINIAGEAVSTTLNHVNEYPLSMDASPGSGIESSASMDRSSLIVRNVPAGTTVLLQASFTCKISGRSSSSGAVFGAAQVIRNGTVIRTVNFADSDIKEASDGSFTAFLNVQCGCFVHQDITPYTGDFSYVLRIRWWDNNTPIVNCTVRDSGFVATVLRR